MSTYVLISALVLLSLTGCGQLDQVERWNYHLMTGRDPCQVADVLAGRCQGQATKETTR